MSDLTNNRKPGLEELVDYPSVFVFRAMGVAHPDLEERCRKAVRETLGRPAEATEVRSSAQGNYASVRVGATVISADEIRALYAALHAIEGVRMVL